MSQEHSELSWDSIRSFLENLSERLPDQKGPIVFSFALVGICWGISKVYFWTKRRKTRQRIEVEREALQESKTVLYNQLIADQETVARKEEVTGLPFAELRKKLQDGKLTAALSLRTYQLKALEANENVNAIAHIIPNAKELAEAFDRGASKREKLLGGVPVSIKDHYTLQGRYATIGLGSYLFRKAEEDCVIVKVLKHHGAVPFVVTNPTQMIMGARSWNPIHGDILSPLGSELNPGGSSTGEGCLIGAGGSILGFGSDIGGSIRNPCLCCGICGLKPTANRLSSVGAPDYLEGQNLILNCFGPMARDMDGIVQAMRALWDGYMFDLDPSVVPMTFNEQEYGSRRPLKIGYYVEQESYLAVAPPCQRAVLMVKEHLEKQGHELIQWDAPVDLMELGNVFIAAFTSNDNMNEHRILAGESELDPALPGLILNTARFRVFYKLKAFLQTALSNLSFGMIPVEKDNGSIAKWWEVATKIKEITTRFNAGWAEAGLDALICPTEPIPVCKKEHLEKMDLNFVYAVMFNLLNMPAGVLPVTSVSQEDLDAAQKLDGSRAGVADIKVSLEADSVGLPVSVQVAAPAYRDERCLRIMKLLAQIRQKQT